MNEAKVTVDIRAIPPEQRNPRIIFDAFDSLAPGETMLIVNDHSPEMLRGRFADMRPGQFEWTYLEEGPETWRVRITRV